MYILIKTAPITVDFVMSISMHAVITQFRIKWLTAICYIVILPYDAETFADILKL